MKINSQSEHYDRDKSKPSIGKVNHHDAAERSTQAGTKQKRKHRARVPFWLGIVMVSCGRVGLQEVDETSVQYPVPVDADGLDRGALEV